MKKTAIIFALVFLVSSAIAQDAPRSINAGVVNGKAISLPKPLYPDAAKAAGISGVIGVNVIIDEAGNVTSAVAEVNDLRERHDVDGTKLEPLPADPSLRAFAEDAARKAKFPPSPVGGPSMYSKGKLVYSFVASQNPVETATYIGKMATSGVLNGKAIHLPKPGYPAAALAVRASGAVSVQVIVDEEGNTTSAAAISGHPLLRKAAEAAALQARFSPTMLSGQPVKISGVLTYNFVLPKIEEK